MPRVVAILRHAVLHSAGLWKWDGSGWSLKPWFMVIMHEAVMCLCAACCAGTLVSLQVLELLLGASIVRHSLSVAHALRGVGTRRRLL